MFAALRRGEGYQKQYIEAQDNEGSTALMLAVQKGSLAVGTLVLCFPFVFLSISVCFMGYHTVRIYSAPSNT